MKEFRANGKLLISGEYFVLDGALSLGLPTRFGQRMTVECYPSERRMLHWQSFDVDNNSWFEAFFNIADLSIASTSDEATALLLQNMLRFIASKNALFPKDKAFRVQTFLEFPRNWGLGSSSTLIVLLGKWSNLNPFDILFHSMKGSGYDIACGMSQSALTYQLLDGKTPKVEQIDFHPTFRQHIYFVHLNQKQNSRDGIALYRQKAKSNNIPLATISDLTNKIIQSNTLEIFNQLILKHETIIADTTELPRAKDVYFPDYRFGEVKSLGAWGGDFVMVTSNASYAETMAYFKNKGFETVLSWEEMIL
jgi:mevalonate kinase